MELQELYRYLYAKEPLGKIFPDAKSVPPEYLMDWLKDTTDYVRLHSDEEIERFRTLPAEEILSWLEEASEFVWETHKR